MFHQVFDSDLPDWYERVVIKLQPPLTRRNFLRLHQGHYNTAWPADRGPFPPVALLCKCWCSAAPEFSPTSASCRPEMALVGVMPPPGRCCAPASVRLLHWAHLPGGMA